VRSSVRRGQTLIGAMVTLVILCLVVLVVLNLGFKRPKPGQSMPARVTRQAENIQCLNLLRQYRMMVMVNEQPPKSIRDFGSPSELRCPVCGMYYRFDPRRANDPKTHGLYCPYPGHRNL